MNTVKVIGDFGGTNARLATVGDEGRFVRTEEYKCEDFPSPAPVIEQYINDAELDGIKIERGLFAVAGTAKNPSDVIFTNGPWKQRALDFTDTRIEQTDTINDFDAICYSVAALKREQTETIISGRKPFFPSDLLADKKTLTTNNNRLLISNPKHRFVTIGPGTGLGVASGLITDNGQLLVTGGEGGHSDFAPADDDELALRDFFVSRDVIVTRETIASGTGLVSTFNAVCDIRDIDAHISGAAELPGLLSKNKPKQVRDAAAWTFNIFAKALGRCASATALNCDARTVFIAGGVIPKLGANFYRNAFRQAFRENDLGAANELQDTPVVLITHPQPGLLGAQAYLDLQNG